MEELKSEKKVVAGRIRKLQDKAEREEMLGSNHRMKKVKKIPASDRIVGGLNIRLRIHENGTENLIQARSETAKKQLSVRDEKQIHILSERK